MITASLPDSAHLIALESVVRRIEAHELRLRAMEAEKLRLLAEAFDVAAAESDAGDFDSSTPRGAGGEIAYRSVRAELATGLHVSEATIDRQLGHAHALNSQYPEVLAALGEGRISETHTRVIVGAGLVIGCGRDADTGARRHSYGAAVLEVAEQQTPNRLRPIANRLAEQFAEATFDERHDEACTRRRVFVVDGEDGMSDLIAHLPSIQAHAIYDRLTGMSRRLQLFESAEKAPERAEKAPERTVSIGAMRPESEQRGRAQCRTRDQLRADLLGDVLLTGTSETLSEARIPGGAEAIRARVQVVVTDEVLFSEQLRLAERAFDGLAVDLGAPTSLAPAEVGGCGPVGTRAARELAATARHWQLVHQDPVTGAVLSVERYRPSEAMRRLLAARDLHCRFPGCRAPIHRCDIDHTIDAAKGGPTSTDNLSHLCRGHHTLKHHGGWRVEQSDDGALEWRSPTGRRYRDRPPSRVRFMTTMTRSAHSVPF